MRANTSPSPPVSMQRLNRTTAPYYNTQKAHGIVELWQQPERQRRIEVQGLWFAERVMSSAGVSS